MQGKLFERQLSSYPLLRQLVGEESRSGKLILTSTFVPVLSLGNTISWAVRVSDKHHENQRLACESDCSCLEVGKSFGIRLKWNFITIDTFLHILPLFFRSKQPGEVKTHLKRRISGEYFAASYLCREPKRVISSESHAKTPGSV